MISKNSRRLTIVAADQAGDEILKRFAERLRTCCGPRDTLARLGGDEFGFVITELEQPEIATTLAWKILETVAQPIHHNGQDITLSLSVGIDLSGPNANEPTTLLKNADLAMYRAKADGCGTFRFFEAEMDARARDRRTMELELRQAIERNEIELHYQPQINANTDEILGFEALLRWHHPQRGSLRAEHFVPLAEETGLIIPIGEWALRQACLDIKTWPEKLYVSVNVSPVQFRNHDLALLVADVLEECELPGHRLEIEVTESLLSREMKTNLLTLHGLKRLGVRIAMDDFGTGFSSLRNLRSFPFDKIKIDRSYVGELYRDPDAAAIVRAVLGLGRSLGLATCAEGVETKEQLVLLRAEGCREVQGSFFSDPIAAKEISDLLQMGASRPVYRIVTDPLG